MKRNERSEYRSIEELPRELLLELVGDFAKNWLAMDGVWFQSVEAKYGMEEAMAHDETAWERYTVFEARRIREFLALPERAGLDGLSQALGFRMYAALNRDSVEISGNTLTYRVHSCRVQAARTRRQLPLHPCKSVGIIEYSGFARTIDPRIETECVSCHPDVTDESCACVWRFTLTGE